MDGKYYIIQKGNVFKEETDIIPLVLKGTPVEFFAKPALDFNHDIFDEEGEVIGSVPGRAISDPITGYALSTGAENLQYAIWKVENHIRTFGYGKFIRMLIKTANSGAISPRYAKQEALDLLDSYLDCSAPDDICIVVKGSEDDK